MLKMIVDSKQLISNTMGSDVLLGHISKSRIWVRWISKGIWPSLLDKRQVEGYGEIQHC